MSPQTQVSTNKRGHTMASIGHKRTNTATKKRPLSLRLHHNSQRHRSTPRHPTAAISLTTLTPRQSHLLGRHSLRWKRTQTNQILDCELSTSRSKRIQPPENKETVKRFEDSSKLTQDQQMTMTRKANPSSKNIPTSNCFLTARRHKQRSRLGLRWTTSNSSSWIGSCWK